MESIKRRDPHQPLSQLNITSPDTSLLMEPNLRRPSGDSQMPQGDKEVDMDSKVASERVPQKLKSTLVINSPNNIEEVSRNFPSKNNINLSKQKLVSLPHNLQVVSASVIRLDLSYNDIKDLPEDMSHFSSMKWLRLTGNWIKRLPCSLAKLPQLESLLHEWALYLPRPATGSKVILNSNGTSQKKRVGSSTVLVSEALDLGVFKEIATLKNKNGQSYLNFEDVYRIFAQRSRKSPDIHQSVAYNYAVSAILKDHKGMVLTLFEKFPGLGNNSKQVDHTQFKNQSELEASELYSPNSLLSVAIQTKKPHLIYYIVSKLSIVNSGVNSMSGTPLHQIISAGVMTPPLLRGFLKMGANPDFRNYYLQTPLHFVFRNFDCSYKNSAKMSDLLLLSRANPNIRDYQGSTPLILAIDYQQKMAVKYAVDWNKHVNTLDSQGLNKHFDFSIIDVITGSTLLHKVAAIPSLFLINQIIIDGGCDILALDFRGKLASEYVQKQYLTSRKFLMRKETSKIVDHFGKYRKRIQKTEIFHPPVLSHGDLSEFQTQKIKTVNDGMAEDDISSERDDPSTYRSYGRMGYGGSGGTLLSSNAKSSANFESEYMKERNLGEITNLDKMGGAESSNWTPGKGIKRFIVNSPQGFRQSSVPLGRSQSSNHQIDLRSEDTEEFKPDDPRRERASRTLPRSLISASSVGNSLQNSSRRSSSKALEKHSRTADFDTKISSKVNKVLEKYLVNKIGDFARDLKVMVDDFDELIKKPKTVNNSELKMVVERSRTIIAAELKIKIGIVKVSKIHKFSKNLYPFLIILQKYRSQLELNQVVSPGSSLVATLRYCSKLFIKIIDLLLKIDPSFTSKGSRRLILTQISSFISSLSEYTNLSQIGYSQITQVIGMSFKSNQKLETKIKRGNKKNYGSRAVKDLKCDCLDFYSKFYRKKKPKQLSTVHNDRKLVTSLLRINPNLKKGGRKGSTRSIGRKSSSSVRQMMKVKSPPQNSRPLFMDKILLNNGEITSDIRNRRLGQAYSIL